MVMIMRDKLVYRGGVERTFVATRMSNASFVMLECSCFFLFCLFIYDSLRKRAFRVSNVCLLDLINLIKNLFLITLCEFETNQRFN